MQKFKIIHQNAQYLRNKTEIFTVFLESTSPDILAISERGLKEDEITQCLLEGYTLTLYSVSHSRVVPENVGLQKEQKYNTFACHTCNEMRLCVLGIRKKEVGNTKR
jgi:hypothetical protein